MHSADYFQRPEYKAAERARGKRRDRLTIALYSAKRRARLAGMPFKLKRSDLVLPKRCPICRKKMILRTMTTPSIDRVDNRRGYTEKNCRIICRLCNLRKGDASLGLIRRLLSYMESNGRT